MTELSAGVRALIGRMESNPEEFTEIKKAPIKGLFLYLLNRLNDASVIRLYLARPINSLRSFASV